MCDKFVFSNDFSSAHTFDPFIFTLVDTRRKKIFLAISVAIFGYTIYLLIDNLPYCIVRDVAAAPQTPQLGGPRPTLGAQVSLKLLFGYVTIFSSADLFTTDLNCRKKLACEIISECNVILSRRI